MIWTEGEPEVSGYYLVLVRGSNGHPQGNPWVFLARVFIDERDPKKHFPLVNHGRPVYLDHYGGSGLHEKYPAGKVVAYCDPTPENFAAALSEIVSFYPDSESQS